MSPCSRTGLLLIVTLAVGHTAAGKVPTEVIFHRNTICRSDGHEMILIGSNAMKNAEGQSHTVNHRWNQMRITLRTE